MRDPNGRADLLVAMLTAGYRAIPSDQQYGLEDEPTVAEILAPEWAVTSWV